MNPMFYFLINLTFFLLLFFPIIYAMHEPFKMYLIFVVSNANGKIWPYVGSVESWLISKLKIIH